MLGDETLNKVGCAHPHCKLPHDQHTYDTVAFLQLQQSTTNKKAQEVLKKVCDHIGSIIDGFAFVESFDPKTKEQYKIT